jgi:alpha-ketoglutarate-dependent taurine dioxygenase
VSETDRRLVADALSRYGWFMSIPGNPQDAVELIRTLGPILANQRGNGVHQDLIPYTKSSAPQNSMSSFIGTGEQPMHTDRAHSSNPPRYVALYCLEPGDIPCSTYIWRPDCDRLLRDRPRPLTSPQWVFRDGDRAAFYAPVLKVHSDAIKLRFDPCCMRPASFCDRTTAAAETLLREYTQQLTINWQRGSLLILDNWRCLHARAALNEDGLSRRLRRWYIGESNGVG